MVFVCLFNKKVEENVFSLNNGAFPLFFYIDTTGRERKKTLLILITQEGPELLSNNINFPCSAATQVLSHVYGEI